MTSGSGDATRRGFDVCVIGSGAAGAVVVDHLVTAGWDVVLVEEGRRVAPGETNEEVDARSPRALAREGTGWSASGWPWTTRNLGGGTVFYGGASFRYRPVDFDARDHFSGNELDPVWPYSLDDLAPYYSRIERRLGISGGVDDGYEHGRGPPHARSASGQALWQGALARNYRPFATPLAIRPAACAPTSPCICHPCPTGAKSDAVRTFLDLHRAAPNLVTLTGVKAVALIGDARLRVTVLRCIDLATGAQLDLRARYFVVACNAIQSAALLLRSRTEHHPAGLGNDSDLVGRGLCMKMSRYVSGAARGGAAALDDWANGPFSTVAVLDHYVSPEAPSGLGGLMYEARPERATARASRNELLIRVEAIIADRPRLGNRVALAGTEDETGVPRVMIDYTPHPDDLARLDYLSARAAEWIEASGGRSLRVEESGFERGSAHLHGTCRGGSDPRTSVCDPWSRLHTVDNVFIADGAFMPFPGGLNPTLTIQAHALRTAERLCAELP